MSFAAKWSRAVHGCEMPMVEIHNNATIVKLYGLSSIQMYVNKNIKSSIALS